MTKLFKVQSHQQHATGNMKKNVKTQKIASMVFSIALCAGMAQAETVLTVAN